MISPSDISTIASRVLAEYDVSEAYLFGSFARGEQTPDSDIYSPIRPKSLTPKA